MNKVYLNEKSLTPQDLNILFPEMKTTNKFKVAESNKKRSITVKLSNGNTSIVYLGVGVSAELIVDDE